MQAQTEKKIESMNQMLVTCQHNTMINGQKIHENQLQTPAAKSLKEQILGLVGDVQILQSKVSDLSSKTESLAAVDTLLDNKVNQMNSSVCNIDGKIDGFT